MLCELCDPDPGEIRAVETKLDSGSVKRTSNSGLPGDVLPTSARALKWVV